MTSDATHFFPSGVHWVSSDMVGGACGWVRILLGPFSAQKEIVSGSMCYSSRCSCPLGALLLAGLTTMENLPDGSMLRCTNVLKLNFFCADAMIVCLWTFEYYLLFNILILVHSCVIKLLNDTYSALHQKGTPEGCILSDVWSQKRPSDSVDKMSVLSNFNLMNYCFLRRHTLWTLLLCVWHI